MVCHARYCCVKAARVSDLSTQQSSADWPAGDWRLSRRPGTPLALVALSTPQCKQRGEVRNGTVLHNWTTNLL